MCGVVVGIRADIPSGVEIAGSSLEHPPLKLTFFVLFQGTRPRAARRERPPLSLRRCLWKTLSEMMGVLFTEDDVGEGKC